MSIQRRNLLSLKSAGSRLSVAALAMGLGILLILGPLAPPASAATAAPTLDSTFASLLNTLRTTLGIGTLAVDGELSTIARNWSANMASTGTLAHNASLQGQAQGWAILGENVGTGGAVTQVFNALVASPPHMRNMSNGQFTRIGVGTVTDSQNRLWTTHVFMRPKAGGAVAAPAPKPAPAAAPTATAPAPTAAPKPPPAAAAAPVTAPPTTAAPVTVPVPTPVAAPAAVEASGSSSPIEAPVPVATPAMASATQPDAGGIPPLVLVGIGLLALLVLAGGGAVVRRATRPSGPSGPGHVASSPQDPAPEPSEDLTKVLDLLYN